LVRATEEAKSDGEATLKSIIVALDGSELAERVIPMAAGLAKKLGLAIVLFRAYHILDNADMIAGVRDEANEYLEKQVAEVKKLGVEKASFVTKEGFAADEIIALGGTTPGGLIFMCSHGRSGVKRWVLGSVTETVVRHSGNPVLVVRAGS
jgi:nucleotide-binding universal stress UspA family protein